VEVAGGWGGYWEIARRGGSARRACGSAAEGIRAAKRESAARGGFFDAAIGRFAREKVGGGGQKTE